MMKPRGEEMEAHTYDLVRVDGSVGVPLIGRDLEYVKEALQALEYEAYVSGHVQRERSIKGLRAKLERL